MADKKKRQKLTSDFEEIMKQVNPNVTFVDVTDKVESIPSPSEPQPLEAVIRQKVCQLTCGDDLCEGAKDKFYCPDCNATTQEIMQAITASQPKCEGQMPLIEAPLTENYWHDEGFIMGRNTQRDTDWQWHLAKCAECKDAHIQAMAEKEAGK